MKPRTDYIHCFIKSQISTEADTNFSDLFVMERQALEEKITWNEMEVVHPGVERTFIEQEEQRATAEETERQIEVEDDS